MTTGSATREHSTHPEYLWGGDLTAEAHTADGVPHYGSCTEVTQRKAAQVMLYVAESSRDDDTFSLVRLHKVLWEAETRCFFETERPLTGSRYVAQECGPVIDGFKGVMRLLLVEKLARIEVTGGEMMLRVNAGVDATLNDFPAAHRAIVDEVVDSNAGMSPSIAFEEARNAAWKVALSSPSLALVMPYELACFADQPPTDAEVEEACARRGI